MTLVELHVDVARVADALEKLVFLVEKLVYPPAPMNASVQPATLADLYTPTEQDHLRIKNQQSAFAELHRVMPGSEAFDRELLLWEEEQRRIHGEEWKAPDWAFAFGAAAQERAQRGPVPEPAEAAGERGSR